jgi:hypothetical protein
MKIQRIVAVIVVLALLGCGSATAAETSDDRSAIFAAQAARITELGEPAEGLVRCGIRSEHWSYKLHITITEGVQNLSDRLWPDSWKDLTDDGPSAARSDALDAAYRAIDAASERGRHVTPQWCVSTGSTVAPELDEFTHWQE